MPRRPKRRPSPPLRSTKPRWSRAGTLTSTRSTASAPGSVGAGELLAYAPEIIILPCMRPRLCEVKHIVGYKNQASEVAMPDKERIYSEDELTARLAKELPRWRYENGWIRRKSKAHSWKEIERASGREREGEAV